MQSLIIAYQKYLVLAKYSPKHVLVLLHRIEVQCRAKDTVVEAMEGTDYPYLRTYQFHPEMMRHTELNAAIFKDFVEAAKKGA